MKKLHIQSPAGLASLFPGLVSKSKKTSKRKAKPVRSIKFEPGLMEASGVDLKLGDKITIKGLRVDETDPRGYVTNCQPGQETVMVMGNGEIVPFVEE